MFASAIRITVWNEFRHEKTDPPVARIYPDGIHETIAGFLRRRGCARWRAPSAPRTDPLEPLPPVRH